MPEVSAGARLDRLPVSAFHRRLLGLIAGGMFFDGFDVYLAGGVLGALVKDGMSDLDQNAAFISATFAGMTVGALTAGILGDRFGRRFSYQSNLAIFGLASLAGAVAPSMGWLIVLRFVMGIGLGAEIVIGYAMLSEFVPPTVRGKWAASLAFVANSALLVATMLNFLVVPRFGWRWMFASAGIGALSVFFLRKSMPESPRWLQSVGRHEEADRVLDAIERDVVAETGRILAPPSAMPGPAPGVTDEAAPPRISFAARLAVASVVNVATGLALYGFVAWVPTFLIRQGFSVATSLGYSAVMSLGGPLGAVLAYTLSDRIGRKAGLVLAAFCTLAFGGIYCRSGDLYVLAGTGFALFTSIYFLLSVGVSTYVPELFETAHRMRAVGIASTLGRLATMASPFAVVSCFNYAGITGVYGLLAAALVIMIVVVAILGVETRGKALERIGSDRDPALHPTPSARPASAR